MTQGELILGLLFKYVENWDYQEPPHAVFKHKDNMGDWTYDIADLRKLVASAKKLGLDNKELQEGLKELEDAQNIFDRIKPMGVLHSFYS